MNNDYWRKLLCWANLFPCAIWFLLKKMRYADLKWECVNESQTWEMYKTYGTFKLVYYYSCECDLRDHTECYSIINCQRNQSITWFISEVEAQSRFKNRQGMKWVIIIRLRRKMTGGGRRTIQWLNDTTA